MPRAGERLHVTTGAGGQCHLNAGRTRTRGHACTHTRTRTAARTAARAPSRPLLGQPGDREVVPAASSPLLSRAFRTAG